MNESVIKVGKRNIRRVSSNASSEAFIEGSKFNESLQSLPTGNHTFIPKGVHFFKTNQEADKQRETCLIQGMAKVVASCK